MRFSLIIASISFALSVNAASVNKRGDADTVSSAAQACISSLTSVNQALNALDVRVANYTASQGYNGWILVIRDDIWVEGNVTAAGTSCCAITPTLAANDATAVLSEESTVANSYVSVINTFIRVKPQFDSVVFVTPTLETHMKDLLNKTTPVLSCLTAIVPTDLTSIAQGYATSIENSLQQGITAYAS